MHAGLRCFCMPVYKPGLEGWYFSVMRVLALNCGSSSAACALIDTAHARRLQEIHVENIGSDLSAAVDELLAKLSATRPGHGCLKAVVHRVVHGGEKFRRSDAIE